MAGAAGENSFGAHTAATILLAAMRPAAARDPGIARLVALLACSVEGNPGPGVSRATARWCTRVYREECALVDRLVLAIRSEAR
jgi:hypothetical protein